MVMVMMVMVMVMVMVMMVMVMVMVMIVGIVDSSISWVMVCANCGQWSYPYSWIPDWPPDTNWSRMPLIIAHAPGLRTQSRSYGEPGLSIDNH